MKHSYTFLGAVKRNALVMILLIAGASMLLPAQQRNVRVISDQSTATMFLGTPENPTAFNLGLAKVRGKVQVGEDKISASEFNFTIYADSQASSAEAQEQSIYGNRSAISFQSRSVERRNDGTLEVRGTLSVTQVLGRVTTSNREEGSDPAFNQTTQIRASHEVTFLFHGVEKSLSSGQKGQTESGMLMTASTTVSGETFPELSFSVQDVAWPPARSDGSPQQSASAVLLKQPAQGSTPSQQSPPTGDLITIQLNLKLSNTGNDPAQGSQQF